MKEALRQFRAGHDDVAPKLRPADVVHALLTDTHVPISVADVVADIASDVISGPMLKRQDPSKSGTLTEPPLHLLTWISL
jgi:hypothetical protein